MQTVFYSELSVIQTEENGRETNMMPPLPGGTASTKAMKEHRSDASPWREKYEIMRNRACFSVPVSAIEKISPSKLLQIFLGPSLTCILLYVFKQGTEKIEWWW